MRSVIAGFVGTCPKINGNPEGYDKHVLVPHGAVELPYAPRSYDTLRTYLGLHTFEGIVRFFDAAGGVPRIARTDRMGALGQSQGRRFVLGPEALEFARHHGVEIKACQADRGASVPGSESLTARLPLTLDTIWSCGSP